MLSNAAVERLLDANLDRAREGLRVLEDWARFALDRPDLVARCKDMRQLLGMRHADRYKLARHTASDPAAGMGHPAQLQRLDPSRVVGANASRVAEALRVLEEFGRADDPELAVEAAAIRYRLYDLEVELLQAVAMAAAGGDGCRQLLGRCHLYLICGPRPGLESIAEAALQAGVRLLQYRAKAEATSADGMPLNDSERLQQARALRELTARHGALLIINDRIDLAMAVGADGVHLGQGDLPPALARRLLGPKRLIGRSTHCLAQLRQAIADGCDYVGVGPVHATPTKPGRPPVGLDYVQQAAGACPIPFFAIGGIEPANLASVLAAGATRVAVVRAISEAEDPRTAAARLLAGLQREC